MGFPFALQLMNTLLSSALSGNTLSLGSCVNTGPCRITLSARKQKNINNKCEHVSRTFSRTQWLPTRISSLVRRRVTSRQEGAALFSPSRAVAAYLYDVLLFGSLTTHMAPQLALLFWSTAAKTPIHLSNYPMLW